jgi:hypothetical protein
MRKLLQPCRIRLGLRGICSRRHGQALPPFVDAMTCGFLFPLICDVKVENGEFTWDNDLPPGGETSFVRSPIGFHDIGQVSGTPLFEAGRFLIKFHNLWTIEAPDGYALLFTHPVNRFDLPFTTLTGLVDCDKYSDNWIHFPARWNDANFSGVLRKGTPIAQCMPIKREGWTARVAPLNKEETQGCTISPLRYTMKRVFIAASSKRERVSSIFQRARISRRHWAVGRNGRASWPRAM